MSTAGNDISCVVQLGRYGNIINILPLLRHIHAHHGTPVLMVSRQFSDLLEGVSYVQTWAVDLDYREILQAVRLAEDRYARVMGRELGLIKALVWQRTPGEGLAAGWLRGPGRRHQDHAQADA